MKKDTLRRLPVSDEIPTSSMADIAFLLIIFFMVTATFAATRGLDLEFPVEQEQAAEIDPVEAVLVAVLGEGRLELDGRPIVLGELLAELGPKLAANPLKPVIVKPGGESAYGAVVDVLDELRQGRQRLGLEQDVQIALPTEREARLYWR